MDAYVGVDLGATNVRAIVGDGSATVLGEHRRPTPPGPSGIDVTEAVLDAVRGACDDAGVEPETVEAAGIGSFGPFDLAEGTVVDPANLPDSVDVIPLTGPVEQLIDAERVYVHNDTTAGVIGERFHSERNPDDMVYLTISSGIGAGVCVDGEILDGWDGNAGEVGHYTVDPTGARICGCGRPGHWEAYCSGNNLPGYVRDLAAETNLETALDLDDPTLDGADVFALADGDPLVDHALERMNTWNALGVADVVHSYAPLVIRIGGAVALNNEAWVIDPLRERVPEMVISNVPEIEPAILGEEAVVKGALASAVSARTGDRRRTG